VTETAATPGRLVVIAGPTGTGKSQLGLALAERWGGEVVGADSMQLYRGMDIGTAKLTYHGRRGIPHHLIDVLDVRQTASVAAYQREARAAIDDVFARGHTPLLVGGSGLYIQAVIDEIDFPGRDPAVRARLLAELADRGLPVLFQRLAERDLAAAEAIEPHDDRRVVRALEVIELTGRPFTATLPRPGRPRYDAALLALDRATTELDAGLADRVHAMMAAGFVEEVRALEAVGLRDGMTASRALGYRQLLAMLDGSYTQAEAVDRTIAATRRFVRRQRSWFGRDRRMTRLDAASAGLVGRALAAADEPVRP
jgi:tRNA dimethylallyltransferase